MKKILNLIDKITFEKEQKIKPENIKKGVNIFGIEGSLENSGTKITDIICTNLQEVVDASIGLNPMLGPDKPAVPLEQIGAAMPHCLFKQLPTEITGFDQCNNIRNLFNGCTLLLNLPFFNTECVTNMEQTFAHCGKIETIPPYNTKNVNNMDLLCLGCKNLKNVPALDTSNVEFFDFPFMNCPALTDESLNNILQMCINAKKLTPDSILLLGLSKEQAARCRTLSNWPAAEQAGWTTDAIE